MLCQYQHGEINNKTGLETQVYWAGNNCHCIAICTECAGSKKKNRGFLGLKKWGKYKARELVLENCHAELGPDGYGGIVMHVFPNIPPEDREKLKLWEAGQDERPQCPNCYKHRIDFLVPIYSKVRPRRTLRKRKAKRFCSCV